MLWHFLSLFYQAPFYFSLLMRLFLDILQTLYETFMKLRKEPIWWFRHRKSLFRRFWLFTLSTEEGSYQFHRVFSPFLFYNLNFPIEISAKSIFFSSKNLLHFWLSFHKLVNADISRILGLYRYFLFGRYLA